MDPNSSPVYLARIHHLKKAIISEQNYSLKLNESLDQQDMKLRDLQTGQAPMDMTGEEANAERQSTLNHEYEMVRK
jgi:hypothetical protein